MVLNVSVSGCYLVFGISYSMWMLYETSHRRTSLFVPFSVSQCLCWYFVCDVCVCLCLCPCSSWFTIYIGYHNCVENIIFQFPRTLCPVQIFEFRFHFCSLLLSLYFGCLVAFSSYALSYIYGTIWSFQHHFQLPITLKLIIMIDEVAQKFCTFVW